jgi:hypothetical protein
MTQNQLAYQANQERIRTDLAQEKEKERSNREQERMEREKHRTNTFVNLWRTILGR